MENHNNGKSENEENHYTSTSDDSVSHSKQVKDDGLGETIDQGEIDTTSSSLAGNAAGNTDAEDQ